MTGPAKLGLTQQGLDVLSTLGIARAPGDLEARGLPAQVIAVLQAHGLLEEQDDTHPPLISQDIYAGWKSQRGMLIDHTRTRAFDAAIRAAVTPGDRVVDVGNAVGRRRSKSATGDCARSVVLGPETAIAIVVSQARWRESFMAGARGTRAGLRSGSASRRVGLRGARTGEAVGRGKRRALRRYPRRAA